MWHTLKRFDLCTRCMNVFAPDLPPHLVNVEMQQPVQPHLARPPQSIFSVQDLPCGHFRGAERPQLAPKPAALLQSLSLCWTEQIMSSTDGIKREIESISIWTEEAKT